MTLLSFNGRTVKAIGSDAIKATTDPFARGLLDRYYSTNGVKNNAVIGGLTGIDSYNVVSYVFRCVNLRANEIANFPRQLQDEAGNDVTEDEAYKAILPTTDLLFRIEAARCLSGQSYLHIMDNGRGRGLGLEWWATPTINPQYDAMTRKVAFFRRSIGLIREVALDRMIYFWNPNFYDDNQPGIGESEVCLGPSSGLYAMDAFLAQFLNGGAVPVTIFPIDPATQESDKKDLQSFIDRRMSGVKNAFRNIVLRWWGGADRKPITIGSTLKDVDTQGLTTSRKEDIAEAHGMSPNVADGGYKYATANDEYTNFIFGTILPRVEQTFEVMTKQFYSKFGLTLVALPKRHEAIQTSMLMQAQTVQALVGKPVLSVNEGREVIELDPIPNGDWPTEDEIAEEKEEQAELEQARTDAMNDDDADLLPADESTVKAALTEWRRAARSTIKQGGAFVLPARANIIPAYLAEPINNALATCKTVSDVNAVFDKHWPIARKVETHPDLVLAEAISSATRALNEMESGITVTESSLPTPLSTLAQTISVDLRPVQDAITQSQEVIVNAVTESSKATTEAIGNMSQPINITVPEIVIPEIVVPQPIVNVTMPEKAPYKPVAYRVVYGANGKILKVEPEL